MSGGPTANWNQLLERFAETLDDVQQRLAKVTESEAEPEPGRADAHLHSLAETTGKQAGLEQRLTEITGWVDAIEAELRVSEDLVRVLLTQTEAVRQKLATWAGRAIG